MTYKIVITDYFKKQFKRIRKKDSQIKDVLVKGLESFSKTGSIHIGKGVYKMRLGGRGMGKSGGYRVYILVLEI